MEKARGVKEERAAPVKAAAKRLGVHKTTLQFWLEGKVHSRNVNLSREARLRLVRLVLEGMSRGSYVREGCQTGRRPHGYHPQEMQPPAHP